MRSVIAAAILSLAGTAAFAHQLDEYLQGTILSIDKHRVQAQMTLTTGVAVLPFLISSIDADASGSISEPEQRAYAELILRDLSVTIDGHRLTPQLRSMRFPTLERMKEGQGRIELDFSADLPPGARDRKLRLENHHQSRISAYQVNSLVPSDPDLRITAQKRDYTQSVYELDYTYTGLQSGLWSSPRLLAGSFVLLLFTRLLISRRRRPIR